MIAALTAIAAVLPGCQPPDRKGKIEIELVQYKPEAVEVFEMLEEKFNASHDNIHLTIESPNDAMTILKTRFIREDAPDIIGIGGDINYSNFLDSEMLMDISDYRGLADINPSYLTIDKQLEFIPMNGTMRSLMWQMPPVFYITAPCFRRTDGKSRKPGKNLRLYVIRYKPQESSLCTSALKIPGTAWHPGTP